MKRRETIKTIVAGSIGTGLIITGCEMPEPNTSEQAIDTSKLYGRTPEEKLVDQELQEVPFFNDHEMATVVVLADLIIPADDRSGSATDAGVPEFIDFMMKDFPEFQLPVRGGLMWMDHECLEKHGNYFIDCTTEQQKALLDRIADSETAAPADKPGVLCFETIRKLTATGFFTSEMGIKDLDYQGNVPNFWDGVPEDVLKKHGLEYEPGRLTQYVRQEDMNKIPEWDEEGKLVG